MTFCVGMRVKSGIVGIADTRVTSGPEYITAKKLTTYNLDGAAFFVMTSGLRSVRDKVLTYFNDEIKHAREPYDRLYKIVNLFARMIRLAEEEDREALESAGTKFVINALIGGQCTDDGDHRLYQVYPEANWVEIGPGTPYHIIGASGYGKPILDRTLIFPDSLEFALKVGCLAFDSTRISAANVGFPIDVVVYEKDAYRMVEHRFEQKEFQELSEFWQERLRKGIDNLHSEWFQPVLDQITGD